MSYYLAGNVCDIYNEKELNVDQKAQKLKAIYKLPDEYDNDLTKIFSGQLPLVRALEVVTKFQGKERKCVQIYEQPLEMDREVQKSLVRLFEYIGNNNKGLKVIYEQWNWDEATEKGKDKLRTYMEKHNITSINVIYPKVVKVWGISGNGEHERTVEGADGGPSCINMLTGLVVE